MTLIVAFALAMGAYALTASGGGGTGTRAGYVAPPVSGYTISNPAYTFNGDATKIDLVAFDLDAAATVVKIKPDSTTGSTTGWYACTNTAGTHWQCDTTAGSTNGTQLLTANFDQLAVAAKSN